MIKFYTESISHFVKEYNYPDETVCHERYCNIDELISSLQSGDTVVVDVLSRLGDTRKDASISVARIYGCGAHLLIDMEPLLSSAMMKFIAYNENNEPIYGIHTDENYRKQYMPFSLMLLHPFMNQEQDLFSRDDGWYWDFVTNKTSYAACQGAIGSVAQKFGIDVPYRTNIMREYEKTSVYFQKLRKNCRKMITMPRRDANYEKLQELLVCYKNSGVTIDMFYELQKNYGVGTIDAWRLLYGYVDGVYEQKLFETNPDMKDSHIMKNLYTIYDTLAEKCYEYANFGISNFQEFWH